MLRPLSALATETEIRAFERHEAARLGLDLHDLMLRAGAAIDRFLHVTWPEAQAITIVCGPGNNGGDGFVLARLLALRGRTPRVVALTPESRADEARRARTAWLEQGGAIEPFVPGMALEPADLVVDAVFGIGLARAPEGNARAAIEAINACACPVLSVDLPSGVHTDTGECLGVAVRATRTLALIAGKRGLRIGAGRACAGQVACDDLGLASPETACRVLGPADRMPWSAPRAVLAHKGSMGRVLVIGGSPGMAGAALLAAGAARTAAPGYVCLASTAEAVAAALVRHPEVMATDDPARVDAWLDAATAVALGPGLGQDEAARARYERVLARHDAGSAALVLDADALNLLALAPRTLSPRVVLTPHPGEAGRLLGVPASAIEADRAGAAHQLAQRHQAIVVLKGAGTLIAHPDGRLVVCDAGNPGMACAGMGDVLCGLLGGALAQPGDIWTWTLAAVQRHAEAADAIAQRHGVRAVTPSAVIDRLGRMHA